MNMSGEIVGQEISPEIELYIKDSEPYLRIHANPHAYTSTLLDLVPDEVAVASLVNVYSPLAEKLADRFSSYEGVSESEEDLRQVAYLGLVNAIHRFDKTAKIGFQHYAVPCILGEIKRHHKQNGWDTHVPGELQMLAMEVQAASIQLFDMHNREPTFKEIVDYLEITEEEGLDALLALNEALRTITLIEGNIAADNAEDTTMIKVAYALEFKRLLEEASEGEREAFARYVLLDQSQKEIAKALNVSRVTVSRRINAVKVRSPYNQPKQTVK